MKFSPQQIANQSVSNLNCYILLTMAYLKERGESPNDWLYYIGQKFIKTWSKESSLMELAEGIVLNNFSGGAKLVSLAGDDTKIEIILEQWPPQNLLAFAEVSWEDAQLIHEVLRPSFDHLGIKYLWRSQESQVVIELSR